MWNMFERQITKRRQMQWAAAGSRRRRSRRRRSMKRELKRCIEQQGTNEVWGALVVGAVENSQMESKDAIRRCVGVAACGVKAGGDLHSWHRQCVEQLRVLLQPSPLPHTQWWQRQVFLGCTARKMHSIWRGARFRRMHGNQNAVSCVWHCQQQQKEQEQLQQEKPR